MDLKMKIRTYNFWISLASAVLVVLRLVGDFFGFKIDSGAFMDITTAVCGVLVVLGIIIMPTSSSTTKTKSKQGDAKMSENAIEEKEQNVVFECKIDENETQNTQNNEQNVAEVSDADVDENALKENAQGLGQIEEAEKSIDDILDELGERFDATTADTQKLLLSCIKLLAENPKELAHLADDLLKMEE